jgi:hypothetical protein
LSHPRVDVTLIFIGDLNYTQDRVKSSENDSSPPPKSAPRSIETSFIVEAIGKLLHSRDKFIDKFLF